MFCAQTTLLELSFTAIVSSFTNPERLRQLKTKECQSGRNNKEERRQPVWAGKMGKGLWTLTFFFVTFKQVKVQEQRSKTGCSTIRKAILTPVLGVNTEQNLPLWEASDDQPSRFAQGIGGFPGPGTFSFKQESVRHIRIRWSPWKTCDYARAQESTQPGARDILGAQKSQWIWKSSSLQLEHSAFLTRTSSWRPRSDLGENVVHSFVVPLPHPARPGPSTAGHPTLQVPCGHKCKPSPCLASHLTWGLWAYTQTPSLIRWSLIPLYEKCSSSFLFRREHWFCSQFPFLALPPISPVTYFGQTL